MTNPQAQTPIELGSTEFWERLSSSAEQLCWEVCSIDLVNLDQTLQRHAALRGWVNAAHEAARVVEERAKWDLTKAEARAIIAARDIVDAKGKTPPVEIVKAQAALDPNVEAATIALRATEERRGALRAMSSALEDRKDMLVQLAAKRRQEQGDY
jgi:hypothetical protein